MLHTTITLAIMAVLVFGTVNAQGELVFLLPAPQKQMDSGTAVEDVVCNTGLTLVSKINADSVVCVKPSTAVKLLERGWGYIIKESEMMEEQRQAMIQQLTPKTEPVEEIQEIIEETIITEPIKEKESSYHPQIIPSNFVSEIDNKYFTLTLGTIFLYESETDEGVEKIRVTVTNDKQMVMGVETTVVSDKVWLNDVLIEDTKDWFAQDVDGNVWYFGEESKEYSTTGRFLGTQGSWEAGVDDAEPGIIMKASPQVGDSYRQEYHRGVAEDMGEVVEVGVGIVAPYGEFFDCIKTKDWDPLETNSTEYKYYCSEVGNMVMEEDVADDEEVELLAIGTNFVLVEPEPEPDPEITEQQAIEIAQNYMEGQVTDVEVEFKFGQFAFVVEMQTAGGEIDIIIDRSTGEVLGIDR